ncbi:MAG: EAL and HDOD domain-containing protein [Syntrophobacteraceae bacterium]
MERIVVRQPIFDSKQVVFGYKILCSSHHSETTNELLQPDLSLKEIENTFLLIGFDKITSGKKAFVDLTRSLFEGETEITLPKDLTVVEISYCLESSETLIRSARWLKEQGYALAADASVMTAEGLGPLGPLVDIVKTKIKADGSGIPAVERLPFANGKKFLAEAVNTRAELKLAVDAGYDYFQGYFFSDPVIITEREIPQYELSQLRILHEVNRPELDYRSLENVIKQDVSLSYRLLRYINSAFFGLRQNVSSIKQALTLLGEREIKRWASLIIMTGMGKNKPAELVVASLIRANFCEALAGSLGHKESGPELFMMGLFSMLDVFLGRPLKEIIEDMPLSEDIKSALSGKKNKFKSLFDLVVSYERGDIKTFLALASRLNVKEGTITGLYLEALERAEESLQLYGPQKTCEC